MSFAEPLAFLLLLVPAAVVGWDRLRRRPGAEAWPLIRRLWAAPGGLSAAGRPGGSARRWRLVAGLVLLVFTFARPQWGRIEERVVEESREVLIALDLSRSMLAEDVKPTRLGRARLLIESLLDRLQGERVGLLLFSGTAFLQSPLSPDYEVLREFLPALDPDYLPEGGTDYDRLLRTALESFSHDAGADRYLIVLSDGEALTDDWQKRVTALKERNVRVVALGVGTERGAVMPAREGGFIKDERGAVVLSRLNPVTLRQLASTTGGAYADASTWFDLAALLQETIERGKAANIVQHKTVRLAERFQWFLAPALLFFAWSYWREFPVRPRPREVARRPASAAPAAARATALLLLAVLLLPAPPTLAARVTPPPAPPRRPSVQLPDTPAPDPVLPKIVDRLSRQSSLNAADARHLAEETINHGRSVRSQQQPLAPGIVHDGLAAVDLGERLDPASADWPKLRADLEDLLKEPPQNEPQQQQQQDQKQEQKQKPPPKPEQKPEQKPDAPPPPQPGEDKPPEQPPPPAEQPPPPPPESQQPPPPAEPPPPSDTQQIGGEPPPQQELKEHPELAVPLQQLDEVRNQDSPARLFQLLQDKNPQPPEKPKKDW